MITFALDVVKQKFDDVASVNLLLQTFGFSVLDYTGEKACVFKSRYFRLTSAL